MGITVNNILYLLENAEYIWIFLGGKTYEFPVDELPEEIKDLYIHSIDDPNCYDDVHPLCLNIDIDDEETIEIFHNKYDDYEI